MGATLYDKVFDQHIIRHLGGNTYQLFVGLHLFHEVTSPQAFAMVEERGLDIFMPERNIATADHAIPTDSQQRPFSDPLAESMLSRLEHNVASRGLLYFSPERAENGIVHVLGPELGLTQPGITIVCGDSHTSTHGAFGALALGIGTSQLRDVLATQSLIIDRLKVRQVRVEGQLGLGVTAKDVILHLINTLGPQSGVGYALEFSGTTVDAMSMDERMTLCNMAVEAGSRVGYCNPDATTYAYLNGRPYAPEGKAWDRAVAWWETLASDPDATFDDTIVLDATEIRPMVTWGVTLGQSVPVTGRVPASDTGDALEDAALDDARTFMGVEAGQPVTDIRIDVAFLGSCTNGRVSDFVQVAEALTASGAHVAPGVRAIAVPGSARVKAELERLGIDAVLRGAGFEFRNAGCSMCIGMNTDKLNGREVAASSSNRNFKGRQGSPTGRTLVMSPISVAAAAVAGHVTDPRDIFELSSVETGAA
jgi:3-isopropylmalate/(R)-2-methylmalate dehydratase large subunit